jgi:GMP synthase (glutamine-hydrolysing)
VSVHTILELRHAECESPGALGAGLADRARIETVRMWAEPLPADPADVDGILVMGGPMGADDGPTVPWIDEEIAFLRRAVDLGVPIWGACLGSQLLATALGAGVTTGPAPEIGVLDVTLTDEGRHDPVWSGLGAATFPALHWHFDTFSLPPGAHLLASSAAYSHQLFRHGPHYGVQFHLEVDSPLLREWLAVDEYRAELRATLGDDGVERLTADVADAARVTHPMAVAAIRRWFDLHIGP